MFSHFFQFFWLQKMHVLHIFERKFWTSWLTHPLAKYLNCLKHVLSFWPYKILEKSMNFEISQICFSLKVVLTWSLLKNLSLGSRVVPVWSGYVFSLLINVWRLIRKWWKDQGAKNVLPYFALAHSRPIISSHRNQSIDLLSKSVDWFLYDGSIGW